MVSVSNMAYNTGDKNPYLSTIDSGPAHLAPVAMPEAAIQADREQSGGQLTSLSHTA